jgi:hypothetical protein
MLEELIAYAGRRIRAGLTVADIVWSIEALEVGYNLRERSHPELVRRSDTRGVPISGLACVGIIEAMTEPSPARRASGKTYDSCHVIPPRGVRMPGFDLPLAELHVYQWTNPRTGDFDE